MRKCGGIRSFTTCRPPNQQVDLIFRDLSWWGLKSSRPRQRWLNRPCRGDLCCTSSCRAILHKTAPYPHRTAIPCRTGSYPTFVFLVPTRLFFSSWDRNPFSKTKYRGAHRFSILDCVMRYPCSQRKEEIATGLVGAILGRHC